MNIAQAIEAHLGATWRTDYPDDQQVADLMNTPSITKVGRVAINDLLGWAGQVDAFAKLEEVAALQDTTDQRFPVRGAAGAALRLFGTLQSVDLMRPDVISMMDGLVSAGVFTAAEKDQLWALGTRSVTPVEYYGVGAIEHDDVGRAR